MGIKQFLALITACLICTWSLSTKAYADPNSEVWFWHEECKNGEMALGISFDNKTIYKTTFPICKRTRESATKERKTLIFPFKPNREITWEGYRDENNITKQNQELEGNIWLAGSEKNALILGISFSSKEAIYMNSLHIAEIGKMDITEIEPGLIVYTTLTGE